MKDEELKGFPTEEQIDFVIDLKRKITLEKGFCTDADIYLAGLKAGRPQWHKVVDGDLPKIENRIVLCICIGGYINNEPNYVYKLLTSREFCLFQPVIEWCELPTFDKE